MISDRVGGDVGGCCIWTVRIVGRVGLTHVACGRAGTSAVGMPAFCCPAFDVWAWMLLIGDAGVQGGGGASWEPGAMRVTLWVVMVAHSPGRGPLSLSPQTNITQGNDKAERPMARSGPPLDGPAPLQAVTVPPPPLPSAVIFTLSRAFAASTSASAFRRSASFLEASPWADSKRALSGPPSILAGGVVGARSEG
jgi:hypothetical protein